MNNSQFRRLVLDTPTPIAQSKDGKLAATPRRDGSTPSALGSRMRSNIPMTPRSVAGVDFARQLAERNASLNPSTTKKFRSSAAPKGTRLASGYQDRTQLRTSAEEDEKAARIKALEEMVKLGQMEMSTFEALRDEIVGGEVKDVHLVKGLDWKLLQRVRRGEDVLADTTATRTGDENSETEVQEEEKTNIDGEFEKLEEKDVQPVTKLERVKKGDMAPPPAMAGRKRNRDEILQELKASRLAAAEEKKAQQPSLGPKFTKVGEKKEKSRIEKDEKGREVLITVDEDGRVKRKVKRLKSDAGSLDNNGLLMPDKDLKPLGMKIDNILPSTAPDEEDDGDIFEDAGQDYDPLGGLEDDEDDNDSDETDKHDKTQESPSQENLPPPTKDTIDPPPIAPQTDPTPTMPPPPTPPPPSKRNYFNSPSPPSSPPHPTNPLTNPSLLAALKKASQIAPLAPPTSTSSSAAEAAKLARRTQMLDSHDRDAEDMDMGFGSSRFEDEADGEEGRVKLSVWGEEEEGKEGGKEGGRGKRKRGKKRRGDGESVGDVLGVLERRNGRGG